MRTKSVISPERAQKCMQALASRGINACRLCGAAALRVEDVVAPTVVDPVSQMAQRSVMPVVAVECGHCLNVMYFDAVRMGLMGKGDA